MVMTADNEAQTKEIQTMSRNMMLILVAGGSLAAQQIVVPDGTPVKLRLNEMLSSGRNVVGQGVNLTVAEDVMVGSRTVIEAGARATGSITIAEPKKSMGRGGKLDFIPEKIQLADGRMVSLRATPQGYKGNGSGVKTGVVTAGLAVAFWPAAPFALMMKGKDVTIPPGATFSCFTDAKFTFQERSFGRSNEFQTTSQVKDMDASTAGVASITINSNVPDAEIEVDGKFVGQAPAKLSLAAGPHRIQVKNGTEIWERTMEVGSGFSLNVNANFSPTQPQPRKQVTVSRQ
jgi:hypothetical protein